MKRQRPDPFVLATAAHQDIAFDLSFTGYREQVLARRVVDFKHSTARHVVGALAAASVATLNSRNYDPADDNDDMKSLCALDLELGEDELRTFAQEFLAVNDYLIKSTEWIPAGTTDSGAQIMRPKSRQRRDVQWAADPIERLHQALLAEHEQNEAAAARLLGPFANIEMFKPAWPGLMPPALEGILDMQRRINPLASLVTDLATAHRFAAPASGILGIASELVAKSHISFLPNDLGFWQGLSPSIAQNVGLTHSYETGVASILETLSRTSFHQTSAIANSVLAPSHSFTRFVQDTLSLSAAAEGSLRVAYETALRFSGEHFDRATNALVRLDENESVEADEDSEAELQPRSLDLFPRHRDELTRDVEQAVSPTAEQLLAGSRTVVIANLVTDILLLIVQCNEAAWVRLGRDIFKPTTRTLRAFACLPQTIPVDRGTLGEAVDDLFFILFEGAGGQKLRFLQPEGGVFERDEAIVKPVFHLKYLRNKWLRHDPEHGSEGDIRKTWSDLGNALTAFGMPSIPNDSTQFQSLYVALLTQIRAFLMDLLSRLQAPTA